MRTYVEGTKLTGDDNVPAGHVAFKAAIGSKESIPGYTMYPPDLGVRLGYKGKGRVAKAKYTEPRYIRLDLVIIFSPAFSAVGLHMYVKV